MYKLLIVDDEPIEREAMRLIIGSHVPEISEIEEAENGFSAIDLFLQSEPEIVLMDINMPGMNGLEAIQAIRDKGYNAKFIIVTSFSQFDYARKAIKLGVEDFLLKPADIDTIKKTFMNVISDLQNESHLLEQHRKMESRLSTVQPVLESDVINLLKNQKEEQSLEPILDLLGIEAGAAFPLIISCSQDTEVLRQRIDAQMSRLGLSSIIGIVGTRLSVIIFSDEDIGESEDVRNLKIFQFLTNYIESILTLEYSIGVGYSVSDLDKLYDSYHLAMRCLEKAIDQGLRICFQEDLNAGDSLDVFPVLKYVSRFVDLIVSGDFSGSDESSEDFFRELKSYCRNDYGKILQYINTTLLLIQQKVSELNRYFSIREEFLSEMGIDSQGDDPSTLEGFFIDQLKSIFDYFMEIKIGMKKKISGRAFGYIRKNFKDNITLESLSESLGISTFYVSKVISREIGKTFTEILTGIRLGEAKKLLVETDLSIKEITFMTGFNSQQYFSRVFKKFAKTTPSEYKLLAGSSGSESEQFQDSSHGS